MASSRTDNFVLTANGQAVECRIVYPYLAKKRDKDWQNKPIAANDQEYEAQILIPKRPDDLLQQPYVGPKELVLKVWQAWVGQPAAQGQWRQNARWPVLDCDIINPATGGGQPETEPYAKERPWAAGHWRIKVSSSFPIIMVDQTGAHLQPNVYGDFVNFKGGDYAFVSIHAWAYMTGSGGVGFGLEAVRKTRDGETIGSGQRTPEQIFGGFAASAPSAQPALPQGFAPPPMPQQYAPAPQQPPFPQAPPAYASMAAPAPQTAAAQPWTNGGASYATSPSSGAPVFGGAPPAPQYQAMPPQPPLPFGTR